MVVRGDHHEVIVRHRLFLRTRAKNLGELARRGDCHP